MIDHAKERAALRKIMADRGFQYGNDAFENVYLGWRLARESTLDGSGIFDWFRKNEGNGCVIGPPHECTIDGHFDLTRLATAHTEGLTHDQPQT